MRKAHGFPGWVALAVCIAPSLVAAQTPIADHYSARVEWRQATGLEVAPIHVGLLPTGKLFFVNEYNFMFHPEVNVAAPGFVPEFMFLQTPTPLGSPLPASVLVEPVLSPPPFGPRFDAATNTLFFKSLVCTGHALMPNGNLFFASGAEARVDMNRYNRGDLAGSLSIDGIADSLTFNPFTGQWTVNPSGIVPGPLGRPDRWYATVTRLADSRMLLTGGYERVVPERVYNSSVEVFDPLMNAWTAVSGVASTPPGVENPDYPHVFQLPVPKGSTNVVMMVGGSGEPLFLVMGASNTWYRSGKFRPGAKEFIDAAAPTRVFPNARSSSALLPLRLPEDSWGYGNGSVLYAGGEHGSPGMDHVDVYDPVVNAWRPSVEMLGARHHPSTVVLPDGRILILAGYDESMLSQTGYAEYVDPRNGFAVTRGTAFMPETRGYHAMTVLLPDGRVLVGGGNADGNDGVERSDFRYYHPDYMFKPRPQIVAAADTMTLGGIATVAVPHGTVVSEVALVGLGAMSHSFDMNQRHVQLRLTGPGRAVPCETDPCRDEYDIEAPRTPELAPPGHYLLFVLDPDRVPSMGRMVRLDARAPLTSGYNLLRAPNLPPSVIRTVP